VEEPAALQAYVKAAAAVLQLPLDHEQVQRVAAHLARTAAMARALEGAPLATHDEPAEIYRPKPFPSASTGREQL
jgi:hypothetical protein